MKQIPFIGGFYTLDSVGASSQNCINWYPEYDLSGMAKYGIIAKPTPGTDVFAVLSGGGGVRGIYTASNNRCFAVRGNTLSEISTSGVVTVRGTINSTSGIIRMKDNGIDLIVVDGKKREGWTLIFSTNTFSQITDSNYPGGSHVEFINQRYLINKSNTQQYQWSDLADGTSWPALNITSAEFSPDLMNSAISLGGEYWAFGPQSYDVQYNVSGVSSSNAFAAIQGTQNDIGNVAPDSLARSDKNIFWLGGDDNGNGKVYTNEGYKPRPISNPAIDQEIQRYSKIDDAVGYCYQQIGHEFYVLSFLSASKTWVYDLTTGLWHERRWTDSNGNHYMVRGIVQDFFNGKVLVGDFANGNIYELYPDVYDDNGNEIHREITSPHIWNNLDRTFYGSFQLDLKKGVGLVSGQGENPQLFLSISNDGGVTFPPTMREWRSAGKMGDYKIRLKWNRLGASRDRVFKIEATDPVEWEILGAFVEVE